MLALQQIMQKEILIACTNQSTIKMWSERLDLIESSKLHYQSRSTTGTAYTAYGD